MPNTEKPNCEVCGDTGWIEKSGGMVQCECVARKAKQHRMKVIIEQSGLIGSLKEKTFDNFIPKSKQQKYVLEQVKKGDSFFLVGPFGTGKTHLLAASVNEALKRGVMAVFFSVPWLLEIIRGDLLSGKKIGIMEKVCEVEYLALDDLGKEKPTDTVQEKLFMILDRREVCGLRTSVTSNLGPETLASERLDGAIISRITGMCQLLLLEGSDYRKEKKK